MEVHAHPSKEACGPDQSQRHFQQYLQQGPGEQAVEEVHAILRQIVGLVSLQRCVVTRPHPELPQPASSPMLQGSPHLCVPLLPLELVSFSFLASQVLSTDRG